MGSEVVGLVPLESMLQTAEYYVEKENLFIPDEKQRIRLAIERLGLNSCSPFDMEERIIEYLVASSNETTEPLGALTLRGFIEELGARSAAPGGGSAAAVVASMGAALGAMVGWMTYGSKKWESLDPTMRRLIGPLHTAMMQLIPMIDADTDAFNDYVAAMRLPKDTPEEIKAREVAMDAGIKTAILVPLEVMRIGDSCWENMEEMALHGNMNSASDLEVGARSLEVGIWGAYRNVVINMGDVTDEAWKSEIMKECDEIIARAEGSTKVVLDRMEERTSA